MTDIDYSDPRLVQKLESALVRKPYRSPAAGEKFRRVEILSGLQIMGIVLDPPVKRRRGWWWGRRR